MEDYSLETLISYKMCNLVKLIELWVVKIPCGRNE